MNDRRPKRGAAAEDRGAEYLTARGITILARNLRCRAGELDIVGLENSVLVVVEVRQRSRLDFGGASASVTAMKQHRIVRATRYFMLRDWRWRRFAIRFDVLALQGPPGAQQITWIKDAFRAT